MLPAWWETWWFRILGAALSLWFGIWVVRGYVTRQDSRRRALETLVLERTQELESANRALQDQTITDPLTGLRNRRFLQFQMPEEAAQAARRHRLLSISRAERLDLNIALHPFDIGEGRILHRTCSVGYTCFPFIPEVPGSLDWERVVESPTSAFMPPNRAVAMPGWVSIPAMRPPLST